MILTNLGVLKFLSIKSKISKLFNIQEKKRVVLLTAPSYALPIYFRSTPESSFTSSPTTIIYPSLPLGVAYLASSLEQAGFYVKVVDLTFTGHQNVDVEKVRKEVMRIKPDAVGISSFTHTISTSYKIAENLKEENKDILVAIGGAHVSALPKRTLEECNAIDAVFIGEGEHVFPSFLKGALSEGKDIELSKLRGVMYKHENNYLGDPYPVYVDDLDSLPFPARHLFDLNKYKKFVFLFYGKPKISPYT